MPEVSTPAAPKPSSVLERAIALGIVVFGLLAAGFVLNGGGADEEDACPLPDGCADESPPDPAPAPAKPATFSMAPPARGDDRDDEDDDRKEKKGEREKERKRDKDEDKDDDKGKGKGKRGRD